MNLDTKTKFLGLICAAMDGRDPRPYILDMSGDECVQGHSLVAKVDELLRAQWRLMGAPPVEHPDG